MGMEFLLSCAVSTSCTNADCTRKSQGISRVTDSKEKGSWEKSKCHFYIPALLVVGRLHRWKWVSNPPASTRLSFENTSIKGDNRQKFTTLFCSSYTWCSRRGSFWSHPVSTYPVKTMLHPHFLCIIALRISSALPWTETHQRKYLKVFIFLLPLSLWVEKYNITRTQHIFSALKGATAKKGVSISM